MKKIKLKIETVLDTDLLNELDIKYEEICHTKPLEIKINGKPKRKKGKELF